MSLEQKPDAAEMGYRLSPASSFALDLTRVLAAQAVLVGHALSMLGLLPWLQPPHFAYIQEIAVVVFFLLSGVLISYTVLSRTSPPTFRDYAIDRFARIYSGLIPALFFIAACDAAVIWLLDARYEYWSGFSVADFIGNVFMLQDYPLLRRLTGITSLGSARVLWTLAIEWWLYMAFGWLLLVRPAGWKFWAGLACLLPVPIYNLVAGRQDGLTAIWIAGVCGCLVLRSGVLGGLDARARSRWLLGLVILAVVRLAIIRDAYDLIFAALAGAALTLMIAHLDAGERTIPLAIRRVTKFAADFSFTLYLVHLSVMVLLLELLREANPVVSFWAVFVASNAVAAALALKTEMQHQRLRSYLKRRFSQGLRQ